MELLIFIKHAWADFEDNWLDQPNEWEKQVVRLEARLEARGLTSQQIIEQKEKWMEKKGARTRKFDIVEVHDDGWWDWVNKTNPKNRMASAYAVIRIPGSANKNLQKLVKKIDTESGEQYISKKFRYDVKSISLQAGEYISVDGVDIEDKTSGTINRYG